jgi:hypothetical protein
MTVQKIFLFLVLEGFSVQGLFLGCLVDDVGTRADVLWRAEGFAVVFC